MSFLAPAVAGIPARGHRRQPNPAADNGGDVAITAVGSSHNQQEYQTFYNGMGGWRWGGFGETTAQVENYQVGTLVEDFYDGHNKQLIWRGVSTDSVSGKPDKTRTRRN